ncbi:MAG: hypothetical protein K0R84_550 [Clostridia bacterium]|jgi:hypothetical protein|nr:hypothetical protein [Clostridia bacterium]
MHTKDYKFADIKNNKEAIERLSKVEEDLSKDLGGNIVLIAYQKDENVQG